MKLLTKYIESRLGDAVPEGPVEDRKIQVHFFDPTGSANWYATEGKRIDGGYRFWGWADLFGGGMQTGGELGYWTLADLEGVKGLLGLGIERDMYYGFDHTLGEVMK